MGSLLGQLPPGCQGCRWLVLSPSLSEEGKSRPFATRHEPHLYFTPVLTCISPGLQLPTRSSPNSLARCTSHAQPISLKLLTVLGGPHPLVLWALAEGFPCLGSACLAHASPSGPNSQYLPDSAPSDWIAGLYCCICSLPLPHTHNHAPPPLYPQSLTRPGALQN